MKVADFRRTALSFEGAEEGSHMGATESVWEAESSPRWPRRNRAMAI